MRERKSDGKRRERERIESKGLYWRDVRWGVGECSYRQETPPSLIPSSIIAADFLALFPQISVKSKITL